MHDERWAEVDALFSTAQDAEPDKRESLVRQTAGDDVELAETVLSLLAELDRAEERIESLVDARDSIVADSIGPDVPCITTSMIGQRLGDFEIVELVARGGMGAVYKGTRADGQFRQTVAIKILPAWSADAATVSRLRAERQILSNLSHPNITRIIDGGEMADGTPYLVTEFIDGLPLTDAADQLEMKDRLKLFCTVAESVHYAHRNLIIHRDIKPSNILVDAEGHPHLLDFGIAKLIRPDEAEITVMPTVHGLSPMTLTYASPEQLKGEAITTASDVYQLGILLYRLLTGSLPDRRNQSANATVTSPSVMIQTQGNTDVGFQAAAIKGDLDTIALKALRPDPQERYGSAVELADDVRRFLAGEAIIAKPETGLQTLRRLSRRSPFATGLAAFAVVVVIGWLASLVVYSKQLEAERDIAQRQAERAESVKTVLSDLYRRQDPLQGDTVAASPESLRAAVDRAVLETDSGLTGQRDIQGELYGIFSDLYQGLGEPELAIELAGRSVDAYSKSDIDAAAERLAAEAQYAGLLLNTQKDDALARFDRVLGELDAIEQSYPEAAVAILLDSAVAKFSTGYAAAAIVDYERAQVIYDDAALNNASLLIEIHFGLARCLVEVNQLDRAEILLTQALADAEREFGTNHSRLTGVLNSLSALERSRGNYDRAIELSNEVVQIMKRDRAGDYENLLSARNNLALVLGRAGRYEDAATLLADVVSIRRDIADESGSANLAMTLKNHATMLHLAGNYEDALASVTESEQMIEVHVPATSPYRATPHFTKALIYLDSGRYDEARSAAVVAEELLVQTLGETHYQVAVTRCIRAEIALQQGDQETAAALVADSFDRIQAAGARAARYEMRCRLTRDALPG